MPSKKKKPVMYEVERVVDVREVRGVKEFLIKWKGYKTSENSWELASGTDCPDLVEEFYRRRAVAEKLTAKNKKRPTPRRRTTSPKKASSPRGKAARTRTPKSTGHFRKESTPTRRGLRSSPRFAKPARDSEESDSDSSEDIVIIERPAVPSRRIDYPDTPTTSAAKPKSRKRSATAEPNHPPSKNARVHLRPNDGAGPSTTSRSRSGDARSRTAGAQASNTCAHVEDIKDLTYTVKSIKGLYGKSGHNFVVFDTEGKQRIAHYKAVAKQDKDLMMDYFLNRCQRQQIKKQTTAAAAVQKQEE